MLHFPSHAGAPRPVTPACLVRTCALAVLAMTAAGAQAAGAVTLDSITPPAQRVHELITLRGQDFGAYSPGVSKVVFSSAENTVDAQTVYVWRDDFIQVRVPVADADGPIPKTGIAVSVAAVGGASAALPLQVITAPGATLSFHERTALGADGFDTSTFLGDPDLNMARTKDAEIGDVNGDGWPDLIDNNSNNVLNDTHEVLRVNRRGERFDTFLWEPLTVNDTGTFVATVPPGGDFIADGIVYDADFVDLDNDELPDWVRAAVGTSNRVRVLMNNRDGFPGRFVEATDTWFPTHTFSGSPDSVAHTDVDFDGFVDVSAAFRFTRSADVYLNEGGQSFAPTIKVTSPSGSASIHDSFFLDANADGFPDIVLVDESGSPALFFHDGNLASPGFTFDQSFSMGSWTGIAADFDADGVDDFALAGASAARVFLNDPADPGTFQQANLPDAVANLYDLEAADVNLDGFVDLVGAAVIFNNNADQTVRVWLNNGDGTFTNATSPGASDLLPGVGPYQRLSADLIDFDLDGDLDLYLTGADGSGVAGFGMVANQFWENDLFGLELATTGACPGLVTLSVTGATPNGRLTIFSGTAEGDSAVGGGRCSGTELGLLDPVIFRRATADANGEVELTRNFGAAECGLFLQALDSADCATSEVAQVP